MRFVLATGLLFSATIGCTTHKGYVPYDQIGVYSSNNAGNRKFVDVGPVSADASSWIWTNCDTVATEAVRELLDLAKARGATTVYNIKFEGNNGLVETPTCHRRWGWYVAYIIPGLGPWMTASAVSGTAAKFEQLENRTSIRILPSEKTSVTANNYVRKSYFSLK